MGGPIHASAVCWSVGQSGSKMPSWLAIVPSYCCCSRPKHWLEIAGSHTVLFCTGSGGTLLLLLSLAGLILGEVPWADTAPVVAVLPQQWDCSGTYGVMMYGVMIMSSTGGIGSTPPQNQYSNQHG